MRQEEFTGKVVIVTGGSQGIGEAIVRGFTQAGARVVILNRNQEKALEVVTELTQQGHLVESIPYDVSNVSAAKSLLQEIADQYGSIDILVNNAGVLVNKWIDNISVTDWQQTMDINLMGAFFLSQAVIPIMKQQQTKGKIICVSSVGESQAFPGASIYCISKAGMNMLVKSFALEYAKDGINVNAVAPGNTSTPINQHIRDNPEMVEWIKSKTPTGRAYLDVSEISNVVMFLASSAANAMHGVSIPVDDGWHLGQ